MYEDSRREVAERNAQMEELRNKVSVLENSFFLVSITVKGINTVARETTLS